MSKTKYKIMFTTSNALFSRVTRWSSKRKNETYPDKMIPSHMIYVFHDNIIVDSTIFKGVRCENFHKFAKSNIIIHEVEYEVEDVNTLLTEILTNERDTLYDLWSAVYNGVKRVFGRMFNIKLSKDNKWDKKHRDYCVELMRYVDEYKGRDLQNLLPFDLMIEKTGESYGTK
jgi:hypothetical protein